jgi:HPt (histidine-containing phosphotransfer) domain-containing protein
MKLSLRFVLLIVALLVGVGASAGTGLRALTRLDRALDGVVKVDMERLLAITHARRLFRSMAMSEREYLLSTTADEQTELDKKIANGARELQEQIAKYAALMPSDDAPAIERIVQARARWIERDERVRSAARSNRAEAPALAALQATDPVSWEAVIGSLVNANEQRLAQQVQATHVVYRTERTMLLSVAALAVLCAAGFGYAIFTGIRQNMAQVLALNSNLEGLVRTRTEALAARERALRLVLDSTGDGIVGIRADGTLVGESSAAAERWFGNPVAGESCAKYLFPDDAKRQLAFALALGQLQDDLLPWELSLDQMPRRLSRGQLVLELDYKQVSGNADPSAPSALLLMRDISARERSQEAERDALEQQNLVAKLLADKRGFATFVSDIELLLQAVENPEDGRALRRNLHTLKGNVAVYGLNSVAAACHQIEDALEEPGSVPNFTDLANLGTLFRSKLRGLDEFLTSVERGGYEVAAGDYGALIASLRQRDDCEEILKMVEMWSWPHASERLARLRAEAEYVARRLGKVVRVDVIHHGLRIPPGYLESFWPTLVHAVRNAVDHGVETPSERAERGKPSQACVRLTTLQSDDAFVIEVEDDGRGIDGEALRRAAERRGQDVSGNASLIDLIFAEGVSSRTEVTELSGRGIGLSAARATCEAEGGSVRVETAEGRGTRLVFQFPRPRIQIEGSLS